MWDATAFAEQGYAFGKKKLDTHTQAHTQVEKGKFIEV